MEVSTIPIKAAYSDENGLTNIIVFPSNLMTLDGVNFVAPLNYLSFNSIDTNSMEYFFSIGYRLATVEEAMARFHPDVQEYVLVTDDLLPERLGKKTQSLKIVTFPNLTTSSLLKTLSFKFTLST